MKKKKEIFGHNGRRIAMSLMGMPVCEMFLRTPTGSMIRGSFVCPPQ